MKLYNRLGHCEHIDHHGDDWRVCEAARISFGEAAKKGIEADTKLIRYLMKHRHTSPFEQCNITFQLRMPIFVMRQFVRHRTFRLNEESARYHEMRDDFYIPKSWRVQDAQNRQGSVAGELNHEAITSMVTDVCKQAYMTYQMMLAEGVATEMARLVLPVNLMTEIVVNVDLHNLMHFLVLRLDSHAQFEIRQLASGMWAHMRTHFPVVALAFEDLVLEPKGIKPLSLADLV